MWKTEKRKGHGEWRVWVCVSQWVKRRDFLFVLEWSPQGTAWFWVDLPATPEGSREKTSFLKLHCFAPLFLLVYLKGWWLALLRPCMVLFRRWNLLAVLLPSHFHYVLTFVMPWTSAHLCYSCPVDSPGKNNWVHCHCLLQISLSKPWIKPASLRPPAFAGRFLTTKATGNKLLKIPTQC